MPYGCDLIHNGGKAFPCTVNSFMSACPYLLHIMQYGFSSDGEQAESCNIEMD
jgi:hypothetical protein